MQSPIRIDDPCVLFALRRESAPFFRLFPVQQRFSGVPFRAWFCGPSWLSVLVVETGVGASQVRGVLDWLLTGPSIEGVSYRPKLILAAGFCGALDPNLRIGDVVWAEESTDESGNLRKPTWPERWPAGPWDPPLHPVRLLTAGNMVGAADEKHRIRTHTGAGAVDMESAWIADRCDRAGIPWGIVRAVSDDSRTNLSAGLLSLLQGGRVSPWKLTGVLLRRPGMVPELWHLARATRLAAKNLARSLGELLTLTLPFGLEL